ncbi:digestive cysteine proteinase 2-like [Amphibalanus amphitrite]|uniref:digestive cysteine proteinase 2-like n=1 Tax=Amphibalanus amphitrite TaxID=1232801 RepID=UPI001C912547|nr:digestive cysteine proteinase 2-like [Amphibalanus amphitrite]XP_043245654.1 digestive cysteine proteinase 2-like [Amphibalanus amphitrite]XP_043245655.1 digestive cysteine proteinase 2-like [Amphibalanus amphitrite]XP_043245657.1 digestive cysteine proteinase 2-like [Amphibalanus amphitrite]
MDLQFGALLLLLTCAAGYSPGDPPKPMPDRYITSGILHLPYAELHEPFSAWVDLKADNSRLDYYNGVMKTYQMGGKDGGSSFKIMPVTVDGKVYNKMMCFKTPGSVEAPMHAQPMVPNVANFSFVRREKFSGRMCDKFTMEEDVGQKHNLYSLWTTTEGGYHPVLYEMKGYDSLLGSHFDHYIVQYTTFVAATPSKADISPPDPTKCSGWNPGAGEHNYLMNPMREFIHNDDSHVEESFAAFKARHGRQYEDDKEHTQRKNHFRHNMRYIHSKNRSGQKFRLAANHFTDRSDSEMHQMRGYRYNSGHRGSLKFPYRDTRIPDNVTDWDWRLRGAVTPVKDQSVCGSCWSFGTTGAVESGYFLHSSRLVRLSQQALIDCSWGQGNNGCDGGEDTNSYKWILKHGLPTEDSYGPYLGSDAFCHVNESQAGAVRIKGHTDVPPGSVHAAKYALWRHGPLSVAIDAAHRSFVFYANGVYYEPECGNSVNNLDHAVLAVGFGILDGEPYWLVKNSWSTYWGNAGYVLMSMKDNNCGVATAATYVNF